MGNRKKMLGARIKELRKRRNLSQNKLSEQISIESNYLSRIEVGASYPSLEVLERIADALRVEMKELFDFSHHDTEVTTPKGIEAVLTSASREDLKLIYKLVQAVLK